MTSTEHYAHPIHPGQPGKSAFWNTHSRRFIWAPAFEFPEEEGATHYRFELTAEATGQTASFTAEKPWAPLSPVWSDIPCGRVTLKVFAVTNDGEKSTGSRSFIKSPPFSGVQSPRAYPYRESGLRCLLDLYDHTRHSPYFEAALEVAKAYRKLQLPQGTWHQWILRATGKPKRENLLIPTTVISFLDRLRNQYGIEEFSADPLWPRTRRAQLPNHTLMIFLSRSTVSAPRNIIKSWVS